jgi:tryptophan synthase alpha chain
VVEQASLDCLECGVTLQWILEEMKARRSSFKAEFVLMGYMNPFLQYGLEKLAEDAAEAGVAGFIIPDVPLEESQPLREVFDPKGLDVVSLVGLNTSRERMQEYAADARGFVYFVTVLGITGVRDRLPEEIVDKISECKEVFDIPVAAGFGIKTPEQVEAFGESIDAVVFGSALIKHIQGGGSAETFMKVWT